MSPSGKKAGAQPGVLRAINPDGAPQSGARAEVAPCPICGAPLEFPIGPFGMTLEVCTNRKCANRMPHRPVPQLTRPADAKKLPRPSLK